MFDNNDPEFISSLNFSVCLFRSFNLFDNYNISKLCLLLNKKTEMRQNRRLNNAKQTQKYLKDLNTDLMGKIS